MPRIDIAGAAELERKLKGLPDKVAKKISRQAFRAGAKVVQKEAKARAPKKSGKLRNAIKVRAMKRRRNRLGVLVQLAVSQSPTFYAAFVELGHKIGRLGKLAKAAKERARRIKQKFGLTFKVKDDRKAVEGKHFLRDAFDASQETAAQVMTDTLRQGIEQQ